MVAFRGDLKCKRESCRNLQENGNSTYEGPEQPCACCIDGKSKKGFQQGGGMILFV